MTPTTPMKAIRLKCLECCCGQSYEVRMCHIKDCALWSYRFGHRPTNKGTDTARSAGFETEQIPDGLVTAAKEKHANSAPTTVLENKEGIV